MSTVDPANPAVAPMPLPPPGTPEPVVSICCITYNHERFIEKALEGFLGQQTRFPIEIIVHDDASTDRTAAILRDYINFHPGRIRAVFRTENQHRQGRGIMPMFAEWAKGEFIAVCEGDDYWTAPDKLQTQVAYMQANPDCVACCHDSIVVDEKGATVAESYFRPVEEKFTQAEVIGTLLSREPTCSLLFRRSAFLPPLPSWYLRRPSDLYLDILITEHGRLGFIDRAMAAYRVHSGGVWSGEREAARLVELIVRYRFLLSDTSFVGRYRELLVRKIAEFEAQLFTRADARIEISRLEQIVQEQSEAVSSTQRETHRLVQREQALLAELGEARTQAQQHIDSLKVQLERSVDGYEKSVADLLSQVDQTVQRYEPLVAGLRTQLEQLAATSLQQSEHIAVLEAERDRLATEAHALKRQLDQSVAGYETIVVGLRTQLEQLATTSVQQTQHITVLERERDRLTSEADAAKADAVVARSESQRHIDALKAQLDRTVDGYEQTIAGLLPQITQTVQRYEAILAPLQEQLNQLANTSRQQTAHISILEQERDRLLGRERHLGGENSHYLSVMEEQSRYIKVLETERLRLSPAPSQRQ